MRHPESTGLVFSLRDLAVFIAVVSLVLALFGPWVRTAREEARRSMCLGHLKAMALGIQNYHDIRQEIPPSYLTDDDTAAALPNDLMAWPILILPFMEQNGFEGDPSIPLTQEPPSATGTPHKDYRLTSIETYFCPTRREPPALTADGNCAVGDYACVSIAGLTASSRDDPRKWDAAMLPCRSLQPREFRSMTTFADVIDGLSHTAFVGEKAVHRDRLGGNRGNFAWTTRASEQDGTFYYGKGGNLSDLNAPGAIAYWSRRLAPVHGRERLLAAKPMENPSNRFGGWHHGNVTLFLMGDASIRPVSNDTETVVLQRLGCRNDRSTEKPTP